VQSFDYRGATRFVAFLLLPFGALGLVIFARGAGVLNRRAGPPPAALDVDSRTCVRPAS
jgi:hypothetical protein